MGSPRLTLEALSDWLGGFQAVFRARGHERVYVGGSGARALLDGSVEGLRDVDLFLDGEALGVGDARAELAQIFAVLEATEVVRAGPVRVRDKRRADPAAPLAARDLHVIGAGTHVFPRTAPLPIVSLTVLRRRRDLELGGIFNFDAVYVVLDTRRPLSVQLVEPIVIDPYDGMSAWRMRRPRVVHWEEVARCHARHGLRIARTLAACGHWDIDEEVVRTYRALRAGRRVEDPDEVFRDLLKLLAAPCWRVGLGLARGLGGFALEPGFEWLHAALERREDVAGNDDGMGGSAAVVALMRARRWLAGLGQAAEEPLARLARAVPGVFPWVEGEARGAEIS